MKKSTLLYEKFILLLTLLLLIGGFSIDAWGQSYNSTDKKWYSLDIWDSEQKAPNATYSSLFQPHTGTLSFYWKTEYYSGVMGVGAGYATVYCKSDKINRTSYSGNSSYGSTPTTLDIKTDATQVQFANDAKGVIDKNKKYGYLKKVKLPVATHIRLKSTKNENGVEEQTFKAFADTYWGTTCGTHRTIELRSFLTTTSDNKITFKSSNPTVFRVGSADNTGTKVYEVGTNAFACDSLRSVSGALKAQSYSCNVYFCPPDVGDYSANITISNGTSSVVVHVSGKGVARNVNITTQPTVKAIEYLSLLGTSTISDDGVAKDANNASTTVAGAFTWKTPTQQIQAAAGTHAYTMVFTPNDKTHYNVKEFNRDLTVQLKTSTITMSDEGHVKVHVAGLNDSSNEWKIDLDDLIVSKMEDALDASRAGGVTYEVTSANKAKSSIGTGNVFSATECGTYTLVATQAATSYYAEATDEFVVAVDRLTPTVTSTNRTIKVDSIVENAFTFTDAQNISTDITIKSISSINNGDGQVIEYDIAHNRIIAHNAGVAEIYLEQASTDYIEYGKSAIYTITVEKRSNEIKTSYKWKDNNSAIVWNRSLGFEDGAYVQFRSNNMEEGAPHIIVRQIEGEDVATFFPDSVTNDVNGDAFYTSFTVGTARWKVSQPENYKYYEAAERQFNLSVGESDMTCDVYTQTWSGEKTVSQIGEIDLGGVGETLYFEMKRNGTVFGDECLVYTYVPGRGWDTDDEAEEFRVDISWAGITGYDSGHEKALPEGTTKIKILKSGSDNPYVNNIHVTRKRWMNLKATADASATISSLAKLERKVGTAAKTATFYVDFSTCSERVKVASNHGNVTFANGLSKDTISTDHSAIVPVTIHYSSDTIESKMVTITVYSEDKNATLTIPVQTTGIETELVYIGEVSYPVNSDNIAATSLFEVREKGTTTVVTGAAITIAKSGVSDAADVVENALEPLCGNKTVNLTASFAGDNRHEPSSLATPQAITIDKIADAVSFNSHPAVVLGKSYDISAWASANTSLTFDSNDDDIFSIDGTTLTAHKVGTTTLMVTAAGDVCTYIGATNSESITVQPGYIFNGNNDNQWEEESNWENGEKPTSDDDVIIRGNLVIDEVIEVKSLTIENAGNVTLTVNGSLTVGSGNSIEDLPGGYGNLHVENGGQVNLSNGTLKVRNFTLDAALSGTKGGAHQNAASGQVANPTKLDVRGEAYFVLTIDPADALTYGWYDFTVPFEVEISNGIYRYGENTPMRSGVDFMIMEYSESRRASGMKGWVNASGTLQPGRAYTITLDKWAYTTYVFKKKTGASTTGTNSFHAVASDVESQTRGWNGLGNGSLSHAQLTDAFSNAKVQLYDHAHNVYVTKEANESNFAVGTAFFIQVSEAQTIPFAAAQENRTLMAPSREVYTTDEFRLTLKDTETDNTTDRLWMSASEEATEEYVIGQDLLKMGTPTSGTIAQMWTMKGGKVLCDVETAMNGERASVPLSFYAPQAGQYELAIDQAPEDVTLYLTYNDQVIWILSFGSYVFDLEKGTTEGYGLRMETNRAPQIATGIDEQTAGAQNRKVMINNTLYIVTAEGAIFDVMGKNIK